MTTYPNVAIAGRMSTGKSTIAWEMANRYGYSVDSLARPIRDILAMAYSDISKDGTIRVATPTGVTGRTGRELMQRLGTDAIRENVDRDFWIRCLFQRLQYASKPWVIDDVRFPNEVEALERAGFYVVRLVRPTVVGSDHPTETQVDNLDVHLEVQNTATAREVTEWLMLALAQHELRRRAAG